MRVLVFLTLLCLVSAYIRDTRHEDNKASMDYVSRYNASWSDLDTRPLPTWFDEAKIGIMLHWGVYSVPSYTSEWFWHKWKGNDKEVCDFVKANYPPGITYQEFAPMFKAELFKPDAWADLFVKAGAKYVVLTSKHHDGFTLFPSKRSFSWNSVELGPKRDLVGELATAVKNESLRFGFLYSLYEWYNPIYNEDKVAEFKTRNYVETKVWPEMKQLVEDYEPSLIWANGGFEASDDYWKAPEFLSWLYNDSPVTDEVVVNDYWGANLEQKHGDYHSYGYLNENFSNHKWELTFKMDKKSWGYRRNMLSEDVLTIEELIYNVVSAVSYGGNALINIGPTKEGLIDPIFQERLLSLGSWLSINGEAIYGTSPCHSQKDSNNPDVWYTCIKETYYAAYSTTTPKENDVIKTIYAIILKWPSDDFLALKDVSSLILGNNYATKISIQMLGEEIEDLGFYNEYDKINIVLPPQTSLKSKYAWTLKINLNKG